MTRVSKKEIEALSSAVEYFEQEGLPLSVGLKSLLDKLDAKAKDTSEAGPSPAQIENCLVMYSSGKVVPMVAARNIFWIKQYQQWKSLGASLEQVETVSRWLGRQGWMAPTTIDQVAWKWPSYLARATAEKAPNVQNVKLVARKEFTGE